MNYYCLSNFYFMRLKLVVESPQKVSCLNHQYCYNIDGNELTNRSTLLLPVSTTLFLQTKYLGTEGILCC